jgi:hypothetical protein
MHEAVSVHRGNPTSLTSKNRVLVSATTRLLLQPAAASTLRRSLGCILATQLGIGLQLAGSSGRRTNSLPGNSFCPSGWQRTPLSAESPASTPRTRRRAHRLLDLPFEPARQPAQPVPPSPALGTGPQPSPGPHNKLHRTQPERTGTRGFPRSALATAASDHDGSPTSSRTVPAGGDSRIKTGLRADKEEQRDGVS